MTVSQSLISFVVAAGLLTITPGLDSALVLRTAATEGASRAILAGFGIIAGCLVWGAVVAVGLGALLAASEIAYTVLKWIGVAYLSWLGLQLICRPRSELPVATGLDSRYVKRRSGWFWKGLFQNLLNPKVGVFYVSFLPQFVPSSVSAGPYTFLLAAIHGGLGLAWFGVLIVATRPIVRVLRRPKVLRAMDRLMGGVFLAFGAKLALSRR
jgi:threonine/homoserine/homoserine lactone efflux protein